MLERELEQRAKRGEGPLLVPGRRPDPELALGRRQPVREDERALLRQPQRRLVAAPPVVERDQAAGELAARLDPFEVGLRDVAAPEEVGAEGAGPVAAYEEVDVADVIRLEDDDERRRASVESSPDVRPVVGRRERVEERDLPAGFDARGGHQRFPVESGLPVWMLDTPEPETRRHVPELVCHGPHCVSGAGTARSEANR